VIRRREEARLHFTNYLSNRLIKLRVGGTLKNPSISADRTIVVADTAVSFFAGVLELPFGILK
jgi:translocation and assembly module TamB